MQDITLEKLEPLLNKVNKPSRYIGHEPGSISKDWESAETRLVLAFPDLYEIGISNMGLRILYDRINNHTSGKFLADRVYAPDIDFKQQLVENNIPLYAVESLRQIKDFDVIAFSLQYELSYPTLLAMLELAGIPYKREDRTAEHPLIIAGGPGAYNPGPMEDYIDAFIFGDGETVLVDIMEKVAETKNHSRLNCHPEALAEGSRGREKDSSPHKEAQNDAFEIANIEGVYMPAYPRDTKIKKRIEDIDNTNYPVNYPVPFSSSVHDRAVIEIRRGCNRMCRFCQPCFVNFPIRERSQNNIIQLVDEALKNTGYEEYSLLSLSSNDYKGIENLVRTLNKQHGPTGASISLPSQRADNFSLELAQLVQAVRKSTITLAPEAGSQRLRNVINKDLSEDQILEAVTSVHQAGWRNVKLYFMIGLPTETFEDLDAIYDLLKKIKENTGKMTITCSVSIFVPKPFTPFQWCAQETTEVIKEKIRYLKNRTKNLKGVKVNVHDLFLCQLEAVFSRGDRRLGTLIEHAYKKGSYLDAWKEHFNSQMWIDAAEECGINLESFATRTFDPGDALPWDMLDIGIENDFFAKEYIKALRGEYHSERQINCHSEFETDIPQKPQEENYIVFSERGYKYRLKMSKTGYLKYISHLDWQKLIYTAIRKSGMKINYSQGFNPAPKISIGVALPLFIEGENECIDIEFQEEIADYVIKRKLNKLLPENSQISTIVKIPKGTQSIEKSVCWAVYRASSPENSTFEKNRVESIAKEFLLKENIIIEKTSKKGVKKVDIRNLIQSLSFDKENNILRFILARNIGNIESKVSIGSLRADEFVKILTPNINWRITRERLLDCDFNELI